MRQHTFTQWLQREVTSASHALLTLYEQRDRIIYVERPQLEREYMEKVGDVERTVILEEIECELLRKKQQMVQIAINRREPIDEAAIDAELDAQRQQMLAEATDEENDDTIGTFTPELEELYRQILREYHPQMHSEMTDAQRQLFVKAQDAYRHADMPAMQLIYKMLKDTQKSGLYIEIPIKISAGFGAENEQSVDYTTDYSLAAELYDNFQATNNDAVLREEWMRYRQMSEEVAAEI